MPFLYREEDGCVDSRVEILEGKREEDLGELSMQRGRMTNVEKLAAEIRGRVCSI